MHPVMAAVSINLASGLTAVIAGPAIGAVALKTGVSEDNAKFAGVVGGIVVSTLVAAYVFTKVK